MSLSLLSSPIVHATVFRFHGLKIGMTDQCSSTIEAHTNRLASLFENMGREKLDTQDQSLIRVFRFFIDFFNFIFIIIDFWCISNIFFICIFVSVEIIVLLILFTILNYMVTWSYIILRINHNLICPAF